MGLFDPIKGLFHSQNLIKRTFRYKTHFLTNRRKQFRKRPFFSIYYVISGESLPHEIPCICPLTKLIPVFGPQKDAQNSAKIVSFPDPKDAQNSAKIVSFPDPRKSALQIDFITNRYIFYTFLKPQTEIWRKNPLLPSRNHRKSVFFTPQNVPFNPPR